MLVTSSASSADFALHIWDLASGSETRRLAGHRGPVKAIQVEENVCLTGSDDGSIRVWDLSRVNEWEEVGAESESGHHEVEDVADEFGRVNWSSVEKTEERSAV